MHATTRYQRLLTRLRPDLANADGLQRAVRLLDVNSVLYNLPLLPLALLWLARVSDVATLRANAALLAVLFVAVLLFGHFSFTLHYELRPGLDAQAGGALDDLVFWAAALVIGPGALWLIVVAQLLRFARNWWRQPLPTTRWANARNDLTALNTGVLSMLVGLALYRALGGGYPLSDFGIASFGRVLLAMGVTFAFGWLLQLPQMVWFGRLSVAAGSLTPDSGMRIALWVVFSNSLGLLALPLAVPLAALYTLHGALLPALLLGGALAASLLANRLSHSVFDERRRARELAALAQLGRDLLAAGDDPAALPTALAAHLPAIVGIRPLLVWLTDDDGTPRTLYEQRAPFIATQQAHAALAAAPREPLLLPLRADAPDNPAARGGELLLVPIAGRANAPRGGIALVTNRYTDGPPAEATRQVFRALAGQITAALERSAAQAQRLASAQMSRELEVAGRIQASFLPATLPQPAGWQIAAGLTPARQTSGDFYDFIALADGRLGVVVADVADKGTGAALYMALSRTLLRTYALAQPDAPAAALAAANARILADTQAEQFVTVFYGVLDLADGTLTYANAGHNPPLLLAADDAPTWLWATGMPLGIYDHARWQTGRVTLPRGGRLLLYSDGITEATDGAQRPFGMHGLLAAATGAQAGASAATTQAAVLAAVQLFCAGAPQADDMTLVTIARAPG